MRLFDLCLCSDMEPYLLLFPATSTEGTLMLCIIFSILQFHNHPLSDMCMWLPNKWHKFSSCITYNQSALYWQVTCWHKSVAKVLIAKRDIRGLRICSFQLLGYFLTSLLAPRFLVCTLWLICALVLISYCFLIVLVLGFKLRCSCINYKFAPVCLHWVAS